MSIIIIWDRNLTLWLRLSLGWQLSYISLPGAVITGASHNTKVFFSLCLFFCLSESALECPVSCMGHVLHTSHCTCCPCSWKTLLSSPSLPCMHESYDSFTWGPPLGCQFPEQPPQSPKNSELESPMCNHQVLAS